MTAPDSCLSELSRTIQSLKSTQDVLMTRLQATESALLHSQQREAHLEGRLQETAAWCARLATSQHRTDNELQAQKHRVATLRAEITHLELDDGRMITVEDAIAEIGGLLESSESRVSRVERVVSVGGACQSPSLYVVASPHYPPTRRTVMSPDINSTTYQQAKETFETHIEEPSSRQPTTTTVPLVQQFQTLFTNIENFSTSHLTLRYQPQASSTLNALASAILGPSVPLPQIFNSSTRKHICSGVITRHLTTQLLNANIYSNFDNGVAKEYTLKRIQSENYWRLRPLDIGGRGVKCGELASIAKDVVAQVGFEKYSLIEVERVCETLFPKFLALIPVPGRAVAEDALRDIVAQTFALAVRLSVRKCDYAIKFYRAGDAYASDAMVDRDARTREELSREAWIVRCNGSPVVVEKRFDEELRAEVLVEGSVILGRKVLRTSKGKGGRG